MDNTSLSHHGVLGMKWGIRRFQRKDGSLTSEGKKHRKKTQDESEETTEERRARVLKSTNASELYKNRDVLSTAEIRERLDRISVERQLASIAESTKKSGIDKINNIVDKFKKVDDVYSTVSKSAIGKKILQELGLEKPEKEFDLNSIWKNRNKLSNNDLKDAASRIKNEREIENEIKKRRKKAEEEQAATDAKKAKEETSKKVERLNKELRKAKKQNDRKKNTEADINTKNKTDTTDNDQKTYTGEVHGEGTSRFRWEKQGRDYVDAEFTEPSSSETRKNMETGRRYIDQLLLEDKRGDR